MRIKPLGFPWQTQDPFLFCVHHDDAYPRGNDELGPAASLAGRNLGEDFAGKDGWRMYHGETVPGFPAHPHRGFETVTIVRSGLVDHSDSLGATARYGRGDTQWLTAGRGIQHSEMFPLVDAEQPNPLELFQIWLNLPAAEKMAEPHFTMLWADQIPRYEAPGVNITVIAGAIDGVQPLPPPPHSWAARPESGVAIWTIKLAPHAKWTVPEAAPGVGRTLYVFRGATKEIPAKHAAELGAGPIAIENGDAETEMLLLAGRPIGEQVAQYGPFVMNTRAEIEQAFRDYQRTRFGGWPWRGSAPVHARDEGRFARRPDGSIEKP